MAYRRSISKTQMFSAYEEQWEDKRGLVNFSNSLPTSPRAGEF
jgi:hypothetical protein